MRSLIKMDHFNPKTFQTLHESGNQIVSVHMNSGKPILRNGQWPLEIHEPPFEIAGKVPWATDAYYLSSRGSFTFDPLFHAGIYYVQEASGMFVEYVYKQVAEGRQNLRILDLCAAPGGKTTLLQSLISPGSILVSNETIKSRVPVLYHNMSKWGFANAILTNNDPAHFKRLPGFFDIILIDAPCSGSGLFRKDPEVIKSWSMNLVQLCSQRQQRILADAWECLKEDGYMIYSTCSYSREENEDIVDAMFQRYHCKSIPLAPDFSWNIVETRSENSRAFGYRFYPDKLLGEGFFISVIQKKQAANTLHSNSKVRNSIRAPKSIEEQLGAWIKEENLDFITIQGSVHAMPPAMVNVLELLKKNLYLKKAGVRLGKSGENEWIPDQELALANFLKYELPSLDLSMEDMLHFLKGEAFETIPGEKGWRAVRYLRQCLGWVKLIEKRINNYYPKSWRIRQ